MAVYSIRNLSFSYPEQSDLVLDNINLDINKGEFVVLCGPSGCGKTTLLKQLKTVLAPHGRKQGEILFSNKRLDDISFKSQSSDIGFVMQNPDNQLVTDKVWHELAFGLESLGYDSDTIRLRVAEIASFFGIQNWFYKSVNELSGGQKQLVNLAGIMAMQPKVLILDEPTSQLDPIAASDFLSTIGKINKELGITVILTEHRLEEAFPLASRVIVMNKGKIIAEGNPKEVGSQIGNDKNKMFLSMPIPMRIHAHIDNDFDSPITVSEGKNWLDKIIKEKNIKTDEKEVNHLKDSNKKINLKEKFLEKDRKYFIEAENLWFKYSKESQDVVKGATLKIDKGEFHCILGGNGTGKSTTMNLLSGIKNPYRGTIKIDGRILSSIPIEERTNGLIGVLPQNPQTLFVKNTVKDDLYEIFKDKKLDSQLVDLKILKVIDLCKLENLLDRHPYDLSGGEQQRLALAKVLLVDPEIIFLDEPTKGLDAEFKMYFAAILKKLLQDKVTIIMISHDIEFCAKYSDRCSLFFDGSVVTTDKTSKFFEGNSFYTTSANRMSRDYFNNIITPEDLILRLGGKVECEPNIEFDDSYYKEKIEKIKESKKKASYKRQVLAISSFIIMLLLSIINFPKISKFVWGLFKTDNEIYKSINFENPWKVATNISIFVLSFSIFINNIFKKEDKVNKVKIEKISSNKELSKRTKLSALLILMLIPLTIFIGVYYLENKKYYFISLLIMLEIMLPFIIIFENRKPKARELVVIAVLCALAVAGRAAFFMIPQFKPVAAITIITGVALGAESGFLVGAMSMLLSNMLYGQGPLTPWQMFSMGIIGFFAGVLFKKGLLKRDKLSLSVYGGLSVFLIYGGLMNPASAITFQGNINYKIILTSYITGIPFDLIHAFGTVFFMMVMAEPMLEKLDRIKVKYGLIE